MRDEDAIDLPDDDFRRLRRYLAPWVFFPYDQDGTDWPSPTDLIPKESWDSIMDLSTDVALKSSSYEGGRLARLDQLHSDWIFSWPDVGTAPYMDEVCLLAGEEFDALVFNALHGWYRQAIGCLRNALETMIVAAALSVTSNQQLFEDWRERGREVPFRDARAWLRDSNLGRQVDADSAPESVFGNASTSWTKSRVHSRLCAYAHSRAGYNNADFWESNGPIFVSRALAVVEREFRHDRALLPAASSRLARIPARPRTGEPPWRTSGRVAALRRRPAALAGLI